MAEIILDTRENSSEFISYLYDKARELGYTVRVDALPFGDIRCGNVIIERKEINDMISSIIDGRLWEQISHMKNNPKVSSIIVVSGTHKDLWKDNLLHISQMEGAFWRVTSLGIPLKKVDNDEQLVDFVLKLFSYAKPLDVSIKRVEKNKPLSIWMSLPNVGYKKAKKLRKEFGTIECLCLASEKDLNEILNERDSHEVYNALRK